MARPPQERAGFANCLFDASPVGLNSLSRPSLGGIKPCTTDFFPAGLVRNKNLREASAIMVPLSLASVALWLSIAQKPRRVRLIAAPVAAWDHKRWFAGCKWVDANGSKQRL
jgi:hypothetical protein